MNNCGSDGGQLSPMLDQVQQRYQQCPAEWLADGGFASDADIEDAHRGGTTVYAPVRHPRNSSRDPYVPLPDDSEALAQWRQRMGSEAAKEIYKQRAATAECVNAIARGRGLTQFLVRGLNKVKAVALWYALAHNLMHSRRAQHRFWISDCRKQKPQTEFEISFAFVFLQNRKSAIENLS